MLRTLDVALIGLMVVGAVFTYQVKQHAENEVRAIRGLNAKIRLQEHTIKLLKADWSVLTQPSRLQRLVQTYQAQLDLQTIEPTQVATLNDLPGFPKPADPPVPAPPPVAKASPPVAKASPPVDMMATGSVVR